MCRHSVTDEQLYKDIEGVLEIVCDALKHLCQVTCEEGPASGEPLVYLLELFDGVCWYFSEKPKPGHWIALIMKIVKLYSPAARQFAADNAQVCFKLLPQDLASSNAYC